MYWIGISSDGYGVGKSTCGLYLHDAFTDLGVEAAILPFAKKIKDICRIYKHDSQKARSLYELFIEEGFDPEKSWMAAMNMSVAIDKDTTPDGEKPRHLYQKIGHEYGRCILGEDVWVHFALKSAFAMYAAAKSSPFVIVSDDVRYNNEAKTILYHIHIADPNSARRRDRHASENSLTSKPHIVIRPGFSRTDIMTLITEDVLPRIELREHLWEGSA